MLDVKVAEATESTSVFSRFIEVTIQWPASGALDDLLSSVPETQERGSEATGLLQSPRPALPFADCPQSCDIFDA